MALSVDQVRPDSLRRFDQIPMYPYDHAVQIKLTAPYLAGQSVAFMGDSDASSLLLGLMAMYQSALRPTRLMMLDFDERLLAIARQFAATNGFGHLFEARRYNVFDPIPQDLVSTFDWFYTNPPYGSHNQGASARLFIARGCELVRTGGRGLIILPHDAARRWTQTAMLKTQQFLSGCGWVMGDKVNQMHRYRLDDDQSLSSSSMLVEHVAHGAFELMAYTGRRVRFEEIPLFYGRNVLPPYPRYIRRDGQYDFDWPEMKETTCD